MTGSKSRLVSFSFAACALGIPATADTAQAEETTESKGEAAPALPAEGLRTMKDTRFRVP